MKRIFLTIGLYLMIATLHAATWSFSGTSYVYFDNTQTKWSGVNLYLIIGKSTYSSVYPMTLDAADTTKYFTSLPSSGWTDAEYMAVIGNSDWKKGNWGYDELKNATFYTAAYTSGLTASDKQKFSLTPQSAENGCKIQLDWVQNDFTINFGDSAKNNCQLLDADKGLVTLIYSISEKRFNKKASDLSEVYVKGSVSMWQSDDPNYRLAAWSSDGCLFRVFRLSDLQRVGNSGQPEFIFHVVPKTGDTYDERSHSSWQGGIDERLVFINNGENMMILLPGDDITEIAQRKEFAKYIAPLTDFADLNDSATIAHLTNFRPVPATVNLFRSYHPYNPDRSQYDTEHERMVQLAKLGKKYGIKSDIALSGNCESKAGEKYKYDTRYTITIPEYYQSIINNNNVLYVGTANGHTPDYNTAVFRTNDTLFGQWTQEVVRFINTHPAPFQIHCSLGADRTGAFSAILAALCGASWEEIAANYHETSNLRLQEYRHPNCVRYELYLLTGEWPEVFAPTSPKSGRTLQEAVAEHFINHGYLTQSEIDTAVLKLQGKDTPSALHSTSFPLGEDRGEATKILKEGSLYILSDGRTYNVIGQPIQ